jgi:putative transposase
MFITTVTKHRYPFFADPTQARAAVETLYRVKKRHPFLLYAFVIIPDHCHFLIHPLKGSSISKIMNIFKVGLTFNIGLGPLWQSRFYVRYIHKNSDSVKNYIHQNPVQSGLVDQSEDYPWSSASGKWQLD